MYSGTCFKRQNICLLVDDPRHDDLRKEQIFQYKLPVHEKWKINVYGEIKLQLMSARG